jgi:hypothetical protein
MFFAQAQIILQTPNVRRRHEACAQQPVLTLLDDIAQQARQAGLLRPEALAALLRDALSERRIERLCSIMDKPRAARPAAHRGRDRRRDRGRSSRAAHPQGGMTRTVADTNIVVSAFLWGGTPHAILETARREALTLFTSAALIVDRAALLILHLPYRA